MAIEHLIASLCANWYLSAKEKKQQRQSDSGIDSGSGGFSWKTATYQGLWTTYYNTTDFPQGLLGELFRRKPDYIDKSMGDDAREIFAIYPYKYDFHGQTVYQKTWFTISAKNRFLCKDLLTFSGGENLRDKALEDFSDKLFAPKARPADRAIMVGDYTWYFDHPLEYNLSLMLMLDSDRLFQSGERVSSGAIRWPKVKITEQLAQQYGISVRETVREALKLTRAFCTTVDDFNCVVPMYTKSGTLELCAVDLKNHTSNVTIPLSLQDLNSIPAERIGRYSITILPPERNFNGEPFIGVPFYFLHDADALTIRGNENLCELYVCRLASGWGGIKFKLQSKAEYYQLAAWLTVALSYYGSKINGWDAEKLIAEYWPDYTAS